jgi:hypothetical protein
VKMVKELEREQMTKMVKFHDMWCNPAPVEGVFQEYSFLFFFFRRWKTGDQTIYCVGL